MGQFWGILAMILSETPVLQFNVTRYTTALYQGLQSLKPANVSLLGMRI
jgi:hypothetical protein